MGDARRLWQRFEPYHAVVYFAPESREAFQRAGWSGFWMGYFATRAAPLGPVPPAPVRARAGVGGAARPCGPGPSTPPRGPGGGRRDEGGGRARPGGGGAGSGGGTGPGGGDGGDARARRAPPRPLARHHRA